MADGIYVTRRIPQAGLEMLRRNCPDVEVNPEDRVLTREELLDGVRGRNGVLCLLNDRIDDAVLEAAGPQCRVFASMAAGFDNIDLAAATRRGVLVTNTPGVLTETTADLAWALLLAVARRIVEGDKHFRGGQWTGWGPMQFLGYDVHGATLGLVGAGRIGTAVGRRATGFDMKVLYADPQQNETLDKLGARRVDLDTLLGQSDFVSLHMAFSESARHLIGRRELKLMKPSACLINTARGPVVDEAALVEALREFRIAGAGLDVYENEPEPAPGLIELDNVVCLPHLGSASQATRERMAIMAAENLLMAMKGDRPANLVNTEVMNARKRTEN